MKTKKSIDQEKKKLQDEIPVTSEGKQESKRISNQNKALPLKVNSGAKRRRNRIDGIGALVSVYWPEDWKSIVLNPKEWAEVLAGNPYSIRGRGFYYEGEKFHDGWFFNGSMTGELIVTYGDDGGTGFIGKLEDADIEEFFYNRISKKEMLRRLN
jgi:hypothetical protein